jgi:hypothetical protein
VVISLALSACGSTAPSPEATQTEARQTIEPTPGIATSNEVAAATEEPTATEEVLQNSLRVGDLHLVPFAPPWFVSDVSAVVFAENNKLRIDAPASPFEPGDEEAAFRSLVFGAVTLDNFDDFDISATFNRQGGVCTGHDKCANFAAMSCIVFGYFDPDKFQIFCIDESSASYWYLDAYNNGEHSSTSNLQETDTIQYLPNLIFQYGQHPNPNEFRLKMENNILYGYVNGQQVFERPGYLPQACQVLNGMLTCTQGSAGEPCNYAFMDGQEGQNASGCSDLVGKIGAACFYILPESIAEEMVAQFGFGIGWDISNCEVTVTLNS